MRPPAPAAVPLAALDAPRRRRRPKARWAFALCVAASLLVGCTAAPDDTATPPVDETEGPGTGECVPAAAGAASDAVAVDEATGEASFAGPLAVTTTERSVVAEGDGEQLRQGDYAVVDISLFSAATGELGFSTGHEGADPTLLPVDQAQLYPGFFSTLSCSRVGDRLVGVIPPSEAFGSTGNEGLGVAPDEAIVLVVDVIGIYGPTQPGEWTDAPEVDFGSTPPSFELAGPAPSELLAHVIEEGDGEVVRYGQSVSVDYVGKSWDTGEVFDESYTTAPRSFSTAQVVEGFAGAIVGHPVGSTVIVVAPPDFAYGQPTGAATDHALAGQTLVFVLEIREVVG